MDLFKFGYYFFRYTSKLFFRIKVTGTEHFPRSGAMVLSSNHISNVDPPILGSWCPRDMYYLAKVELFKGKFFNWLFSKKLHCIPIDRQKIDRRAIRMSGEYLKEEKAMIIFPEGTRYTDGVQRPPKPGVGIIVGNYPVPIVPCYIQGTNRLWASFFGRIKMSITFGPPIPAEWVRTQPKNKEGYMAIANHIMAEIAKIRQRVEKK